MVNDSILLVIREMGSSFTPVEKKIADYILAHIDEISMLSIKTLAQRSGTSDASVLRFCRTIGYPSYREFIVNLFAAVQNKADDNGEQYTDVRPGDDLPTIMKNISLNNCRSIEDTMSVIDPAGVERAVEMIRLAKRVDFYGIGSSGLCCQDAQQKFMRINKTCYAWLDGHSQLTAAALLSKDDTAVFISNSGTTLEILDALAVAKKVGAKTIAITRYKKSPLAEKADEVLYFSTPEITIRSGAMGSRIAMLCIIDILFAGVASLEYNNIKKYLKKTYEVLEIKHVK